MNASSLLSLPAMVVLAGCTAVAADAAPMNSPYWTVENPAERPDERARKNPLTLGTATP